ncbi:putative capsular polysaccharide synthesis family protein [Lacipirellula sp.]|uniref:putative capsular polysaccharide synthesis family protein n=1 Tax=Lacipirellula sp. TaxID=2691419 RepID=UPI003D13989A
MLRSLLKYAQLSSRLYLTGRAPTIVYSKERTGSVALYHALHSAGTHAIATHYLDPAKIAEGKLSGSARWASRHVVAPRKPAKFISLIRNPIDNLLSTFARQEFIDKPTAEGRSLAAALNVSAAELTDRFQRQYLDGGEYRRELNWFDSELKVALGIDVFAYPFDKTLGYGRIAAGGFELLLLRTELPDEAKAAAVAEFLGLSGFQIDGRPAGATGKPGVAGEHSAYRQHYSELKKQVWVPPQHWDAIADSKLVKHFIGDRELSASRAKWAAEPTIPETPGSPRSTRRYASAEPRLP